MTENAYLITFRGEVKQGWNREQVKTSMAGLFKLDLDNQQHQQKLERLFSGRTVIIKEGINKEKAQAYIDAIASAGGQAYIKIKVGGPDGINERRMILRRKRGDRRATRRLSAIMPDRRKNNGRRDVDPNQ